MRTFFNKLKKQILLNPATYIAIVIFALLYFFETWVFDKEPFEIAFQASFLVIQALLTFTLITVTWWYAVETKRIRKSSEESAREMKLTREAQIAPSIIAYFDNQTSNLIDLVIKNIGYGTAKDVKLKIDPPLLDFKDRPISELSLFRQGISFFPPNREFRQIVDTSRKFFVDSSQRPLEYKLTISSSNVFGQTMPDQIIPLDLALYRDLPIHRENAMDKLAEKVDKIATILEKE